MGVPIYSQLGLAGAVPFAFGGGKLDSRPLTALTATPQIIPIVWPDTTQTHIGVFRTVTRLHVLRNDDPRIYAAVALFLRAVDQAIMGVAILDTEPQELSPNRTGIRGLIDREIDVYPNFFVV